MNGLRVRMLLLFAASMILILVFSSMNVYTLFLVAVGGGIMLLAFFSYYRVAAVFGLLLVAISAGASSEISTLTEAGPLFTAVVGLMIPVIGLTLFALSSEFEGDHRFRQRKPVIVAGSYAAACLAVVPASVAVVGVLIPSLTSRIPGLVEMAFVLLVASVGATVLTIREVRLK
jgi:hypothetical protein